MSGLFGKLQSEIEKRNKEKGARPTDLLTLSPAQRRVMRLMLREVQLSYPDIVTAVANLPEKQRLTTNELDQTLTELTEASWLIRMGQDTLISYRINLRHKSGSKVAQGVWGSLEERIKARQANRPKG